VKVGDYYFVCKTRFLVQVTGVRSGQCLLYFLSDRSKAWFDVNDAKSIDNLNVMKATDAEVLKAKLTGKYSD
jgi:hypothetical protein